MCVYIPLKDSCSSVFSLNRNVGKWFLLVPSIMYTFTDIVCCFHNSNIFKPIFSKIHSCEELHLGTVPEFQLSLFRL